MCTMREKLWRVRLFEFILGNFFWSFHVKKKSSIIYYVYVLNRSPVSFRGCCCYWVRFLDMFPKCLSPRTHRHSRSRMKMNCLNVFNFFFVFCWTFSFPLALLALVYLQLLSLSARNKTMQYFLSYCCFFLTIQFNCCWCIYVEMCRTSENFFLYWKVLHFQLRYLRSPSLSSVFRKVQASDSVQFAILLLAAKSHFAAAVSETQYNAIATDERTIVEQ